MGKTYIFNNFIFSKQNRNLTSSILKFRLEYEPWEMAFINGGAIMDEIPVSNRDIHEQVVFRDQQQQPVTNTTANPIEAVSPI